MTKLHRSLGMGGVLGCLLGSWACEDGGQLPTGPDGSDEPVDVETPAPGDGRSDFVSSYAQEGGPGRDGLSAGGAVAESATAPSANASAVDEDSGGAARAISEADILQLSGDRLYALSQYNGLSVIDASNPSALQLLGSYRTAATPFEMYVEDGLVYAMFNGWYSYACDVSGFCSWQTESRVQALDARNPADIRVLSDVEVPGYIADSRRVGDVMYLVTEQSEGCWGCEPESNTTVSSFDVSEPGSFALLDQLRMASSGQYGGGRSIAVTDQRIYISGYDYDSNYQLLAGGVQIVDISDPQGALVQGAAFNVAGPVQSRWQMDEFEGVFRVVTQPGGWGGDQPPVVETFDISAFGDVRRLGALTIQLPRPREVLQSVRFDGERAYAITAEQRDPLFTFDLSDPAAPRQLGELEMPGWVYHMEPRGDRMFALGFDAENGEGALHVSLFDVANLAEPVLLSRVAFGGDWGSFAEGQNQIHKAFSILADQGLILVPFSGASQDEETCAYEYGSGIQLIDFTDTTLTRRGVAPQVGSARRALLHRDHLFGIGDNAVQTFDISNRDAPVEAGQLDVARNVTTVRVLGDHLLRFGSDWMTNQTILDMTPVARASDAEPQAEIDLSALFGTDSWSCYGGASWSGQVFVRGEFAYVPRYTYSYDPENGSSEQRMTFYVVDISDRGAPRAVGSFALDPTEGDTYYANVVQTDNALLVGRSQGYHSYDPRTRERTSPRFFYDVIELGNPSAPTVASRFEVPVDVAGNGWGSFNVGGCSIDMGWGWFGGGQNAELTDGDLVVSQHFEDVPGQPGQVKYYLDRIDVSDPYRPTMLPQINIPGTAIHFSAETNEVVTVDYQETREAVTSAEDCYVSGYFGSYEPQTPWQCRVTRRSLNALTIEGDRAVRTGQLLLDRTRRTGNIAVSDNRIFYTTSPFPVYSYSVDDVPGSAGISRLDGPTPEALEMLPILLESVRIGGGALTRLPSQELRNLPRNSGYYSQLYARDERVFEIFDNTVTVVDTLDPSAPTRISKELPGWGCSSLEVADDAAYCAVGQRGVEVIDLSSMR